MDAGFDIVVTEVTVVCCLVSLGFVTVVETVISGVSGTAAVLGLGICIVRLFSPVFSISTGVWYFPSIMIFVSWELLITGCA